MLLMSTIWAAEADYNLKNLNGTANLNLVSSDINTTSMSLSVNDYLLLDVDKINNRYKVYIDQGTSIMEKGSPDLPKISSSIIIPDKSKMKIIVSNSEYEEYLNVNIAPSKGNLTRDVNPESIPFTINDDYKENKFYPGDLVDLGNPYILRDVRGQGVNFYPVQYNPVTKVLRVYSKIDITISSDSGLGINTLDRKSSIVKTNNEFMHIYDDLFINSNNDLRFDTMALVSMGAAARRDFESDFYCFTLFRCLA